MARRWNFFDLIVEAHKAGTRSNFKRMWPHGYKLAIKQGLLDVLFPENAGKLEKAIDIAMKMNNPTEFRKQYPAMARYLHRHGYRNNGSKL